MYRFDISGLNRSASDDISKLRSLADDLERVANGILPSRQILANSPSIDTYWLDMRPAPCLKGDLYGHPSLSAPTATTSELWIFAPKLGWARTYSRWYRLGTPMQDHLPPGARIVGVDTQ